MKSCGFHARDQAARDSSLQEKEPITWQKWNRSTTIRHQPAKQPENISRHRRPANSPSHLPPPPFLFLHNNNHSNHITTNNSTPLDNAIHLSSSQLKSSSVHCLNVTALLPHIHTVNIPETRTHHHELLFQARPLSGTALSTGRR